MKSVFKYLCAAFVGALALSACVKEERVTYNPAAGTAQTLGEIQGCTLNADGEAITTTYTAVDFGLNVPSIYTLNIGASGADINTKLSATISNGKISFSQKDLNSAILNMGGEADVEFALDFQLVASLSNDKGAAITGDESYVKHSNKVTAKFVPYSTTVLDVDKYDHIWIIGAAESIGAWSHGNVFQYLYNYNGDGKTYTGMIYYTDGAAGGWKLTGGPDWDHGNWGSPNQAEEAEAAVITLLDDGGSKDIKCYSLPYYKWTFDKTKLELKKEFGFTTMGIVGSFNDWNAADPNCVMTYNAVYHRFYIDAEFAADAELKFTADGKWDLNFGVDMAMNGGNIPVAAGKYRIYIDFNKMEYSFDAKMYGQEEPGAPEVKPEEPEEPENPELPEGARPINVLCEATGWDVTNLYGWGGKLSFAWPGQAAAGTATLGGKEYSYWTLEAANWGATGVGLIFNNGTVQTVDIANVTLDGDKCFKVGEAGADGKLGYEELAVPSIRITYKNEAGWEAVSIYGWGDLGDFGGWPGQAMTKEGDVWVYDIPVEHLGKSTSLIFNNAGAGAQTVDLGPFTLTGDMSFDNSNAAIK